MKGVPCKKILGVPKKFFTIERYNERVLLIIHWAYVATINMDGLSKSKPTLS